MEFNGWALFIFMMLWLVQIGLSVLGDTFYDNRDKALDLPLSRHWGVLISGPLLGVMNGYIFPQLGFGWHSLPLLIISGLISWQLCKSWWGIRGHIFPDHDKSTLFAKVGWDSMTIGERVEADSKKYWRHDLSEAGWAFLVFFILQLEIIFEFILTPIPALTVKIVAGFLLLYAPFGVFQPGWAEWSRKRFRDPKATWFWRSFISLIAMWAAILLAAYCKT